MADKVDATTIDKKVVDGDGTAGNNGADTVTVDTDKTTDDKGASVPLATFLELKRNAKQLEDSINEMKATQKLAAEDILKADGKLQELIDSKTLDLVAKQTELEGYKTKADEMEEFKKAKVEVAKTALGDKWDEGYALLSLIALDKLVTSMTGVKPSIIVDGGASGDKVTVVLTAEQKITAKAMYAHLPEAKAFEYYTDNLIKTGKIKKDK